VPRVPYEQPRVKTKAPLDNAGGAFVAGYSARVVLRRRARYR